MKEAIRGLWNSFWSLGRFGQKIVMACVAGGVVGTILAWKVVLPLFLAVFSFAAYLRFSRGKDEL